MDKASTDDGVAVAWQGPFFPEITCPWVKQARTTVSRLPGRGLFFPEITRPWIFKCLFVCFSMKKTISLTKINFHSRVCNQSGSDLVPDLVPDLVSDLGPDLLPDFDKIRVAVAWQGRTTVSRLPGRGLFRFRNNTSLEFATPF